MDIFVCMSWNGKENCHGWCSNFMPVAQTPIINQGTFFPQTFVQYNPRAVMRRLCLHLNLHCLNRYLLYTFLGIVKTSQSIAE